MSSPNHLLYITDAAIPSRQANSIQTMKMCEAFCHAGLKVTLIVPDRSQEEVEDIWDYYDVQSEFEIVRLPWKPGERYLFSLMAPIEVRKIDPDLVYARFLPPAFFSSYLGYRTVFEAHYPMADDQFIIELMFRLLILSGRLHQLVVISGPLYEDYLERYPQLSADHLTTAHDASSEIGDVEAVDLSTSDKLQVGYVGHLYEGKGMSLIAELVKECSWAEFHIVGGTEEDIQYWRSKLASYSNISFHGHVPPKEVPRYHKAMDILLAPYQQRVFGSSGEIEISRWMSPLKIFEYMAARKPILCSDIPVLREIFCCHSEVLCDPSDVAEWVDELRYYRDHPDKAEELGSRLHDHFQERFTYGARAKHILGKIGINGKCSEY